MPKNPSSSRVFRKNKPSKTGSNGIRKPKRQKVHPMAEKEYEVVDVDSYPSPPDRKSPPLRTVYCLKNRDRIKSVEGKEECFILDFDPYDDDSEKSKFTLREDFDNGDADLHVVAERGQVACRDYPHPRHTCAKFHFERTPHDSHCKLCYCYVCDVSAPCSKWVGSSGHCHAFNNEAWDLEKKMMRKEKAFDV